MAKILEFICLFGLLDGKDGEDVPEKMVYQDLYEYKCGNITTTYTKKDYSSTHKFCGVAGSPGNDGGDGGCAGDGGKSGEVRIFGLKNKSNIVSYKENGTDGF